MSLAGAVFIGVVENVSREGGELVVSLQVTGSWKGVSSCAMTVRTNADSESCGFSFKPGESYLIYANGRGPDLTTNRCSWSGLCARAEQREKRIDREAWEFFHPRVYLS